MPRDGSMHPTTHPAYETDGIERAGRWLITCDHASNAVPAWIGKGGGDGDDGAQHGGDLGLPAADMQRHIAWDVGAAGVTRELGRLLESPCVLSRFSRLVIDPNRGEDDPTLLMKLYDGSVIPANRHAGPAELEQRMARLYRPYHAAYAALAARRADTVICAVHSFTPGLRGRPPRPWQVGVLYSHLDERLALPLIARLRAEPDLCVGDNQPYSGHLPGDAIDRHALATGRPNVLIEVRNDLIADAAGQRHWAARLAPILSGVLAESGL